MCLYTLVSPMFLRRDRGEGPVEARLKGVGGQMVTRVRVLLPGGRHVNQIKL